MPTREEYKRALESYLESNRLSMQWIGEVLKDCSIEMFDQLVFELQEKHYTAMIDSSAITVVVTSMRMDKKFQRMRWY